MKPQQVTFYPGPVDQSRGARHHAMGGLVLAENVRMPDMGELRKRLGFTRTTPSQDFPSTGNVVDGINVAGCDMLRYDSGSYYAYDPSADKEFLQGFEFKSPIPSYIGVTESVDGVRNTSAIGAGTNTFTWGVSAPKSGVARVVYQLSNATTGTVVAGLGAIAISNLLQASAVYDSSGGFIWLFTHDGVDIKSRKISNTTGSVVSGPTTYVTASGGRAISGLHAFRDATSGNIVVLWQEFLGTSVAHGHSLLDTSTGAPKSSPAAVLTAVAPAGTNINTACGIRGLVYGGANGKFYYAFWRASPSTNPAAELVLIQVTISTLAIDATTILRTITTGMTNDAEIRGVCSGYVAGNGDRVVFNQYALNDTRMTVGSEPTYNYVVAKTTWNGSAATTIADWAMGSWLASDPSQVTDDSTGDWYVMTGYEDGRDGSITGTTSVHGQRALHLRNSAAQLTSQIKSQALTLGRAPPVFQSDIPPIQGSTSAQIDQHHCQVANMESPFTGKLVTGVGRATDVPAGYKQTVLIWDFAAAVGRPAVFGTAAVYPGGIPIVVGPRDYIHEATPLISPSYITVAAGGGAAVGTVVVAVVYRYVHADGRITRSAPITATITAATTSATITFPRIRHKVGPLGDTSQVEIYCSRVGSTIPTLQYVLKTTVFAGDSITAGPFFDAATAATTGIIVGVPLYTHGGALSNSPAPPCRSLVTWRGRMVASGTDTEGEIWVTQEDEEEIGFTFNAVALRYFWNEGDGPITGAEVVSWDYLALFRRNRIALLSGAGPDSLGQNGAYVPQTLETERGLTAPASLYHCPDGAGFQDARTGRMCIVTQGGKAIENMQGAEDARTGAVLAAVYMEGDGTNDGQVWIAFTGGVIYVQDQRWPLPGAGGQPLRQWWKWTSGGISTTGAMTVSSAGVRVWDTPGRKYTVAAGFQDTISGGASTDYYMKVKTGKLSPFQANGSGMIDSIVVQASYVAAHTLRLTVTPDGGTPSVHTVVASSPGMWAFEPKDCLHVSEIELQIEETASTTEGFVLEAITLNVKPDRYTRLLSTSQKVAPA